MVDNYKQIITQLINNAQKGDPKAQYHLGVLYQDGKVLPKDYIQAVKYYSQAAAKGHAKAQLYLGLLYQNGRGIPKNYQQAAFLYTQAANQGNEKAMYYLGMLHYYGKGTEKNLNEAFKWLTESASRGYPDAQKIIDEILNASKNEISNDISHDKEVFNEEISNLQNISDNNEKILEQKNEQKDDINDLFRQALTENNNFSPEVNPQKQTKNISKHKTKKNNFKKIIALTTLALIAAITFMFFRGQESIDIPNSNTNLVTLNPPVETQNDNNQNLNPPAKFDPNAEIFDIYSLAINGNLSQLQNAVLSGANFNQVNDEGETPLHKAASYNKHVGSVKFLIEQGLDVNSETIKGTGYTPLVFAVIHNNVEAVRVLLAAGAKVNFDAPGISLLSLAVKNDSPEIVNLLLNSKVSPNLKDDKNKLPLDYANELPANSLIKNSPVFERLKAATITNDSVIAEAESDKNKSVQIAIREKKIPDYIFKRGKFSQNPFADKIMINGSRVRFRTEPNTKSKIKNALNKGQILEYYGEWVSPSGERWVLGVTNKSDFGWIYGQYTQLISPNSNAM